MRGLPGLPDMQIDATDRMIINRLQGGFPICERPYAAAAQALGLTEAELLERIERMLASGVLSRFGPLYNAERLGGSAVLAAMQVPPERLEKVVALVNAQPEIAHNYLREHALNLWFVGAAESPDRVEAAFARIEALSQLPVYRFPKEREYFLEFRLSV